MDPDGLWIHLGKRFGHRLGWEGPKLDPMDPK